MKGIRVPGEDFQDSSSSPSSAESGAAEGYKENKLEGVCIARPKHLPLTRHSHERIDLSKGTYRGMAAHIIVAMQNGKPLACKNLVLSDQVSKTQIA